MSSFVQVVISLNVPDGTSAPAAMRDILDTIPELPVGTDIGQSIDGIWVDEVGDPL